MSDLNKAKARAELFQIEGNILSITPYGSGHINRTYLVQTDKKCYIFQKINDAVFTDVNGLMNNVRNVTEYLLNKGVETLKIIPTKTGELFYKGEYYWRMYEFIEDTVTYQTVTDGKVFYDIGKAFGEFQNQLSGFDASVLTEVIPNFHNTPKRFKDFVTAVDNDVCDRVKTCKTEIDFVLARKSSYSRIVDGLNEGSIPLRVTHNDTKLNNILIDVTTNEARAVVDLDTIMPGSMLYDFGDSIRFGASTATEDEKDLNKVHFCLDLFRTYAEGFCGALKDSITKKEKELLPYSAYLITMECGMRFLTDYLSGDTYFAIDYPEHNLVRARTQFKLASEMEQKFTEMEKIINEIL